MKVVALMLTAMGVVGPDLIWEARPGFRDFGRIVVADDVVLTGNVTGTGGTFAFSATTGKLLWRAPGVQLSGPVTVGRLGYSINSGVGLSAYDLKSGTVIWRVPDADGDSRANLLVERGHVYVAGERGTMRAYESSTGSLAWEHSYFPGPGRGSCPTTPVVSDGVLYYGGGEDDQRRQGVFLWALDAASGKELWRFAAKPDPALRRGVCVSAPAVSDGVVAATSGHVIFGVDARTGEERWRQAVVREIGGAKRLQVLSPPLVVGGRAYAMAEDALIGWRLRDGRQEFEFTGRFPTASRIRNIVAAGGLLYFTANFEQPPSKVNQQSFLYAFDPVAGQVTWKHRVNRDVQYVENWPTTFFAVSGKDVYYENHGVLVKLRQ